MSEDSRAEFEQLLPEFNRMPRSQVQKYIWQAAIAWASARQAERERRLVDFMLPPDDGVLYVGATKHETAERRIAAFNAAEQGRKG